MTGLLLLLGFLAMADVDETGDNSRTSDVARIASTRSCAILADFRHPNLVGRFAG